MVILNTIHRWYNCSRAQNLENIEATAGQLMIVLRLFYIYISFFYYPFRYTNWSGLKGWTNVVIRFVKKHNHIMKKHTNSTVYLQIKSLCNENHPILHWKTWKRCCQNISHNAHKKLFWSILLEIVTSISNIHIDCYSW